MQKVFVSYRRADVNAVAVKIYDRLSAFYGRREVATDVDYVSVRLDRRGYVEQVVSQFPLILAIIGPKWLSLATQNGQRRIEDPNDFVRMELEVALARQIPIIPILVRQASLPRAEELPDSLKPLSQLQPLIFRTELDFNGDMRKLYRAITERSVAETARRTPDVVDQSQPADVRKQHLVGAARSNTNDHKPPFQGVRLETLGEVYWIVSAAERRSSGALPSEIRSPSADLTGAILNFTNLSGAQLQGANLSSANLAHANLMKADLNGATLSGCDLTQSILINANLEEANLTGAKLARADLSGATLRRAQMNKLDLTDTRLQKADMREARLEDVRLTNTDLSGTVLIEADLSRAYLQNTTFANSNLVSAILEGAHLENADLSGSVIQDANFSGARLRRANFSGLDLKGTTLDDVSVLKGIILDSDTKLAHVQWGGDPSIEGGHAKTREQRLVGFRRGAQINHAIAATLREQGLMPEASRYRLAEQRLRRRILLSSRKYGAWFFSTLLNVISGYGERISRTLTTYLTVVLGFAALYLIGTNYFGLASTPLSLYQALIQSVVSFHGRGFVSSALQLGDPMAGFTAAESVLGLFIEGIFIATFSRRFLGE